MRVNGEVVEGAATVRFGDEIGLGRVRLRLERPHEPAADMRPSRPRLRDATTESATGSSACCSWSTLTLCVGWVEPGLDPGWAPDRR